MISHISLHVSDYQTGKAFYVQTLKPLGYTIGKEFAPHAIGFQDRDGNHDFWMVADEAKQSTHVCFGAQSQDEVKAFYEAALAAGGKDNGKPGWRKDYGPGYYAAFVHDPDGHNIEAMFWDDSKK